MQKIATVSVGAGGASTITFSSIPATYTDLVLVLSLRDSDVYQNGGLYFNAVRGSSYSVKIVEGSGSGITSRTSASSSQFDYILENKSSYTSNTFSSVRVTIPNYAGSTNKTISFDAVTENNATEAYSNLGAGTFANTSAITSITAFAVTTFAQYSSATLYGITKGSGGATAS